VGKKPSSRSNLLVLLLWLILLPWLKTFLTGGGFRQTRYEETPEILQISYPGALSSDFDRVLREWEAFRTKWESSWHLNRKALVRSVNNLEGLYDQKLAPLGKPLIQSQDRSEWIFAGLYKVLYQENRTSLDNLARAFLWYKEENDLTSRETAQLVIHFIQQIPYQIPEERAYGLSPALEVLALNEGDCDSKSLLGTIILSRMGYNCVMFLSLHYQHAMMGIDLPSTGQYKSHGPHNYYFVEMTAPGWKIGDIPSSTADIEYWHIVKLDS